MSHPSWWHRVLFEGDSGPDVAVLQTLLGAPQTGVMDQNTTARLRGRQVQGAQVPDGVCDAPTAELIGDVATAGLIPRWWRDRDWSVLPDLLRCERSSVEAAIRRFQSSRHIPPTGVVDLTTAIALGE